MQQKSPAFAPREDRGSLSWYGVGKNEEAWAKPLNRPSVEVHPSKNVSL
jgi:hypothetical protein